MRARHRVSKLLLRHGIVYDDGDAWTTKHDRWPAKQHLAGTASRAAFDADYETVLQIKARRDRLDRAIEDLAADSEFTPVVRRLGCLRGVSTLTGFALAVEIGNWDRFTGNSISSFVGPVPSEFSSGQSRVQGPITVELGLAGVRGMLSSPCSYRQRMIQVWPLPPLQYWMEAKSVGSVGVSGARVVDLWRETSWPRSARGIGRPLERGMCGCQSPWSLSRAAQTFCGGWLQMSKGAHNENS
ncbi:transposase [Micromonospora sp. DT81.3]|uniref:transposase n=1 Tax=Micromonospora sp. DT81.3 TaxID=3416523 RepID=UPI003CF82538